MAEQMGLKCIDEAKGLFHLPVLSGSDGEATLNKMSELEKSGFLYNGIENIVGKDAVMIFSIKK